MLWKVINCALLTKVKLVCAGIDVDILCTFCISPSETVEHLYFECDEIKDLSKKVLMKLRRIDVTLTILKNGRGSMKQLVEKIPKKGLCYVCLRGLKW